MIDDRSRALELDFVVAYPRIAERGRKYLMTVDLRARDPLPRWPYGEEEYPVYCMVDAEPAFDIEPVGQAAVVLHRFGGTYGPARFVLTAREVTGHARLRVTLVNDAGLSLRTLELSDVQVTLPVPRKRAERARAKKQPPPDSFGWLHLSNLRAGAGDPKAWDRGVQALLDDVEQLHEKCGPWDLVLCAGDLTQRGEPSEFEQVSRLLETLREKLVALGREPRVLAVPGNHDVEGGLRALHLDVFSAPLAPGESLPETMRWELTRMFASYSAWWTHWAVPSGAHLQTGLVPGDFSMVLEREGLRLGVLGLNNLVAALWRDDARRAELQRMQLDALGGGDFDAWCGALDACLLLTHERLGPTLESVLGQRVPGSPFILQLTSMSHAPGEFRGSRSPVFARWSGRALLQGEEGLSSGYIAGRIHFDATGGSFRMWPRHVSGELKDPLPMGADNSSFRLQADEGTAPERFDRPTPSAPGPEPQPEDWAVVVGLNRYPALGNLQGPENDARAFSDWLIQRAGVPAEHVRLVLSSQFPPARTALEASPTAERIEEAFDALNEVAQENERKGEGLKVGRRLYIYLAGHGFTPSGDEAALLMSNATQTRTYHVPGRPYANWFLRAGLFDEVVLFMDCDRAPYPQAPLRVVPYIDLTDPTAIDRSKLLIGFATQWSRRSREKRMSDGKVRGVFTTALLEGLNGAASDDRGWITASSLADYLYEHMKDLLSPEELADDDVPKEPELLYDQNPHKELVLVARVPPAASRVDSRMAESPEVRVPVWTPFPRQVSATGPGAQDWAIVVGIDHYPGLGDLENAENDARAFHDWVTRKAGVPPEQVALLISSDFRSRAALPREARPSPEMIEKCFDAFVERASENEARLEGPRVGRRLYLYFSGHGCEPESQEPVFLLANAAQVKPSHVAPRLLAQWSRRAGFFEEVVLFMDCSRERFPQLRLRVPPYVALTAATVERTKALYGFATRSSGRSYARRMPDGFMRGLFTTALLEGLNGGASDARGRITASTLAEYLHANMKRWLSSQELDDDSIPREPELLYDVGHGTEFVLLPREPPRGSTP